MQANVFNCFKTFANMKISTKEENNVNLISNVKFWHAAKAAVLVIVILTVWGLFSLPAVFYWGQQPANKVLYYSALLPCMCLYVSNYGARIDFDYVYA